MCTDQRQRRRSYRADPGLWHGAELRRQARTVLSTQAFEMVKRTWLDQRLRNFRAGIEGVISFLKRCFG